MPELIRCDVLLTERGLAPSRSAAQQLIAAGRVCLLEAGRRIALSKPSHKLLPDAELEVVDDGSARYVSRGGQKLAGALAHCHLDVRNLRCLDIGISTGGFCDCLLQAGATAVVGVDVGHGQLHPQLADDPRVTLFEGVNAREPDGAALRRANGDRGFDLIVVDVSFISLTLVLPSLPPLLAVGGKLLCLVKPQFEVGRDGVGRGGIVRDANLYPGVRSKVETAAMELGLGLLDWFDSPIAGGDGNREFFLLAQA